MRGSRHSLFVIGAIAIIAMALSHAFTIGYGVGTERRAKTMLAAQQAKLHTPSHLTIHYERQINGQEDILRLEIDTTYRSIGKGAFRYELICDRTVSLYGSADEDGEKSRGNGIQRAGMTDLSGPVKTAYARNHVE